MAWSTVIGLSVILGILGSLSIGAYKLYKTGLNTGSDKEKLKDEIAQREIRDKVEKIEDEEGEKLHDEIVALHSIDWTERIRLLQQGEDPDSGDDQAGETSA